MKVSISMIHSQVGNLETALETEIKWGEKPLHDSTSASRNNDNTPKARQIEDKKKKKFIGCDKCTFTPTKSTYLGNHIKAMHTKNEQIPN